MISGLRFGIFNSFVFIFLHRFITYYTIFITILKQQQVSPIFISAVVIAHEIGKMAFDNHTGAMADKYGIRRVMAYGLFIKGIGIAFWYLFSDIYMLILGTFLIGIGRSCTVGKVETYTYNMLAYHGKQDMFKKLWVMMLITDGISASLVGLLSAATYKYGGSDLTIASSVLVIMIIHVPFTAFIMKDYKLIASPRISLTEILKKSFGIITKDIKIATLVILSAMSMSTFIVLTKIRLTVSNYIGLDFSKIAMIDSIANIIPVALIPLIYFGRWKVENIRKICNIIAGFLLLVGFSTTIYNMATIITIMGFILIYPIAISSIKNELEKSASVDIRATITSASSFGYSLINILLFAIIGVIAEMFSYRIAVMFISLTMVLLFALLGQLYRKNQ